MAQGLMKINEQKKVYIKTKPFYVRFCGQFDFEGEALLNQETEKAILVRLRILPDDHTITKTCSNVRMGCFSIKPMWVPKSKLIVFKEIE